MWRGRIAASSLQGWYCLSQCRHPHGHHRALSPWLSWSQCASTSAPPPKSSTIENDPCKDAGDTGRPAGATTQPGGAGARPTGGRGDQGSSGGGGGGGKIVLNLLALSVVGAGGAIAYAAYDDDFRHQLEDTVPGASGVLDSLLGPRSKPVPCEGVKPLPLPPVKRPVVQPQALPKITPSPPADAVKKADKPSPAAVTPAAAAPKAASDDINVKIEADERRRKQKNSELEEALRSKSNAVELSTDAAVASCLEAAKAVDAYASALENALQAETPDYNTVKGFYNSQKSALETAKEKTAQAKLCVSEIRKVLSDGRQAKETSSNPALLKSEEALNTSLNRLDKAEAQMNKAVSESNIICNYEKVIKESRSKLRDDLDHVMPDLKLKKSDHLSEDELNYLIAHAHRRIELLQKRIDQHNAKEVESIQKALAVQKAEMENVLKSRMAVELSAQQRELELSYQKKLVELSCKLEDDLRVHLKRQSQAFAEHLHDSLKLQEEELHRRYAVVLEDKVRAVRNEFQSAMACSLGRLQGIESALKARVEIDRACRLAQMLWVSCHALVESITVGCIHPSSTRWEDQLKPLCCEVDAIRCVASGMGKDGASDPYICSIINSLPSVVLSRGVYTEPALRDRFSTVKVSCQRLALLDDGKEASLWKFGLSYLQSFFLMDAKNVAQAEKFLSDPPIDPKSLSTYDLLRLAQGCVDRGDLMQAARWVAQLRGFPKEAARDWLKETRLHLEVRQAAEALMAHAGSTATFAVKLLKDSPPVTAAPDKQEALVGTS